MKRITSILVFLAFLGLSVFGQEVQITGKITSAEDGSALPGVSVIIKGTKSGVSTDVDGNYSISVASDATLVFTSIGMESQEVLIGGQTVIDLALEPDAIAMDEVVVTAFGISREKKSVAYQTESVSGEDLNVGQSTVAAQGLVGKVAGLQVNVQDNGVKPNTQVLLRGLRSISGNNEALVVIDGAIASSNALNDLNPNDIESMNVLKGATAAALYGSQAGNGALIVNTKTGKKNQRFTFGLTQTTTWEEVSFMPDMQTEHGTGWDGDYNNIENTNWGPRFDGTMRQIGPTMPDDYVLETQMVPYAPVKNNLYDFYNRGVTNQTTLYVTGGDETGSFYMSVGRQGTTGIVPDDTYKKNNFRFNGSKRIGKIELTVNANYFTDERDVVGDQIGDQDRAFYWFVLNTPANIPLSSYKDWDNPASYGYADNYYNAFYQNPYWAIGTNRDSDRTSRMVGNMSFKWDIIENINFTTRLGANVVNGRGKNWRAYQDYDEDLQPYHSTVSSFVEDFEFQSFNYTADAMFSGDFNLTSDLSLKAILGAAVYARHDNESFLRANNLSIPDFYDISNGTGGIDARVDEYQKRTVGFFGDIVLGFRDFVYLNASGRQDYSSTLPSDNNGYFYPAFGLSLILTEAIPTIKSQTLSMLKITANNSTVYNDLDAYQINERYSQSRNNTDQDEFPFPYGSVNGFYKARQAVDANIQKEKLNSTELGLNMAMFNGLLTLDGAYFMTKTTNLITPTTPSRAASAMFYLTNIGELEGRGWELTVGGTPVKVGDFRWDLSLSYYTYETKVVSIKDDINEVFVESYGAGYGTYAVVGEAFPQLKAVSYVRDDQDRIVVDPVSGDPLVGDIENMGKTTPDNVWGLSSYMSFKGFTLSATMDYRSGFVYYSQGSDQMEFTGRSMENVSADRQDFVFPNSSYETSPGVYVENTNVPITGGIMTFWQNRYNEIKENYVKQADAFKLRELALMYTLPQKVVDKISFVQKLSIGVVGRNLVTILPKAEYRFSDPEFRNTRDNPSTTTDAANGIGIGGYFNAPPTRTYGFSVNVEF